MIGENESMRDSNSSCGIFEPNVSNIVSLILSSSSALRAFIVSGIEDETVLNG